MWSIILKLVPSSVRLGRHLQGRLANRKAVPVTANGDAAYVVPQQRGAKSKTSPRVQPIQDAAVPTSAEKPPAKTEPVQLQEGPVKLPVMQQVDAAAGTLSGTATALADSDAVALGNAARPELSKESVQMHVGEEEKPEKIKYFRRKRCPALTGWLESAAAFSAIFLLPLIAVVPCSTTAVRGDDEKYSKSV